MPSICKEKSIFELPTPKVDIVLKFVYSAQHKKGFSQSLLCTLRTPKEFQAENQAPG